MLSAYPIARDVVRVRGPEAAPYLQGQLSQDVEDLSVGKTVPSFVLQPTGKVDSWGRVTRTGPEEFVIDVDGGFGSALAARLKRFLLRTKAEIEELDWSAVAFRGQGADGLPRGDGLEVPAGWPGGEGFDRLGPAVEPPAEMPVGTGEEYEAERIVAGVPALGAELTEKTIPAEVGQWVVDASVSFTKGCFTGQELVARIDSRGGNVPRHLRGLRIEGTALPPAGAPIQVAGAEVGEVTSAARSSSGAEVVALGFVRRAVEVPAEGTVVGPDGEVPVSIRALPLSAPA